MGEGTRLESPGSLGCSLVLVKGGRADPVGVAHAAACRMYVPSQPLVAFSVLYSTLRHYKPTRGYAIILVPLAGLGHVKEGAGFELGDGRRVNRYGGHPWLPGVSSFPIVSEA